jgi:hypothetical protein
MQGNSAIGVRRHRMPRRQVVRESSLAGRGIDATVRGKELFRRTAKRSAWWVGRAATRGAKVVAEAARTKSGARIGMVLGFAAMSLALSGGYSLLAQNAASEVNSHGEEFVNSFTTSADREARRAQQSLVDIERKPAATTQSLAQGEELGYWAEEEPPTNRPWAGVLLPLGVGGALLACSSVWLISRRSSAEGTTTLSEVSKPRDQHALRKPNGWRSRIGRPNRTLLNLDNASGRHKWDDYRAGMSVLDSMFTDPSLRSQKLAPIEQFDRWMSDRFMPQSEPALVAAAPCLASAS